MSDVLFPKLSSSDISSYTINYDYTADTKFVIQATTDHDKVLKLLIGFVKSTTDELKQARKDAHTNLAILK